MDHQRDHRSGPTGPEAGDFGLGDAFLTHGLTPANLGLLPKPDAFAQTPPRDGCDDAIELYAHVRGGLIVDIRHVRTRPYTPRSNGKAERFIQTSTREWAYKHAYESSAERAAHLLPWLHNYNHRRPQAALNHKPPLSRLAICAQPDNDS